MYCSQGENEKARAACSQSLQLAPDSVSPYADLANSLLALQRFDEAQRIIQQAQARKLDSFLVRSALFALLFLRADSAAMAEQQQWFVSKPAKSWGFSLASDTEAYAGHLANARELTRRSVDSAIRSDSKENAAIWQENSAIREAAFGNATDAKRLAEEGFQLFPTSRGVEVESALAFAMAGDTAKAEAMTQDLNKRFPLDTQLQSLWLPAIRAQVTLDRKHPAAALTALQPATGSIELGQIRFSTTAASSGTVGQGRWRIWAWRVQMQRRRRLRRVRTQMLPAFAPSPPTKTSSLSEKTATPTFLYSSLPRQSTRNCNNRWP